MCSKHIDLASVDKMRAPTGICWIRLRCMNLESVEAIYRDILSRDYVPSLKKAVEKNLIQEHLLNELLLYYTSGGPRLIRYMLYAVNYVFQQYLKHQQRISTAQAMEEAARIVARCESNELCMDHEEFYFFVQLAVMQVPLSIHSSVRMPGHSGKSHYPVYKISPHLTLQCGTSEFARTASGGYRRYKLYV